ncbi:hypothetical protein ACJ5W6_004420, partial [Enterobacter hormaechei]
MGDCAALFAGWRFAYPAYEKMDWKECVGRVSVSATRRFLAKELNYQKEYATPKRKRVWRSS